MNKAERTKILNFAADHDFSFDAPRCMLAWEVGEAVRANRSAALDLDHLGAFVKYQAMQWNGEWSQEGLTEAWEFLARVQVIDYTNPKLYQ